MEDPESVAEPFVENLEDLEAKVVKHIVKSFVKLPEVLRQLSKLYLKLAGEEAKLYLRLTPKNLMRLLPHKLIKLSNWLSKIYLKLALIRLMKLSN